MIKTKQDLKEYLSADFEVNKFGRMKLHWMNIRYRYLSCLRRYEYVLNSKNCPPVRLFYKFKLYRLSVKSGIQIPPNTFGKGLYIPHHGTIVVNETAKFGNYCVIQAGVNISEGVTGGDWVYLAAGCKIMKDVHISSHCIIGANAVLTKNIDEEDSFMAGVPAKLLSKEGFGHRNRPI